MVHSKASTTYSSILAFKGGKTYLPAILFNKYGQLEFTSSVRGNMNYKIKKAIEFGKWYLIEVDQRTRKGKVG